MNNYLKPNVVVSRCLGFENCRYNGDIIPDKFVRKLSDYVNYITVCPEVGMGLPTPRDPIRIVLENDKFTLFQPATGKDLTKEMSIFTTNFISKLPEVDGFILKGRSPSCGIKDTKIFKGKEKTTGSSKGPGLFAKAVLERYPHTALEDEGRLKNFKIREHFLTRLFTFFRFRQLKAEPSISALVKFQSDNKYLLMAYNQKEQKLLGRIAANKIYRELSDVFKDYEEHLLLALSKTPRYTSNINAMQHIFGYFSDKLTSRERDFFLATLESYREGKVPFSVPLYLLKGHAVKYQEDYILSQTFLSSFPEGLIELSDSGKGDDL